MDRKSAVAAAGAMVLIIAGGTSALVAAQTPILGSSVTTPTIGAAREPTVIVEYVDEAGNPVPAPSAGSPTEIGSDAAGGEIVIPSDAVPEVIWVDITVPWATADAGQASFAGDDDDRYEGGDDDRYEGGDDDRYEGGDDDRHEGGDDDRYEGEDDD